MRGWWTSPLMGTAGVIVALCLVSVPLRHLTSAPPPRTVTLSQIQAPGSPVLATVRLKLLAPAPLILLESADGVPCIELRDTNAGVSEHDVEIPMTGGKTLLRLKADFGAREEETAVFVTLMPAGHDDQTRYATGSGVFEETLHYDWSRNP
jgi:hypothetical protein